MSMRVFKVRLVIHSYLPAAVHISFGIVGPLDCQTYKRTPQQGLLSP
jgi:hypothetical protein